MESNRKWFYQQWSTVRLVAALALLIAMLIGVSGYINQHSDRYKPDPFVADFYANISSELAGIAITVLIIDALNKRRETQQLKEQLIREMGSPDNGIALRAVNELRSYGWHNDGSLRGANLSKANLRGADLSRSDLKGAYLVKANLKEAYLIEIDLQEAFLNEAKLKNAYLNDANLFRADLYGANMVEADLSGANLSDANLSKSNFTGAVASFSQLAVGRSIEGAILPNGKKYELWLSEQSSRIRLWDRE